MANGPVLADVPFHKEQQLSENLPTNQKLAIFWNSLL